MMWLMMNDFGDVMNRIFLMYSIMMNYFSSGSSHNVMIIVIMVIMVIMVVMVVMVAMVIINWYQRGRFNVYVSVTGVITIMQERSICNSNGQNQNTNEELKKYIFLLWLKGESLSIYLHFQDFTLEVNSETLFRLVTVWEVNSNW